MRIFANFEICRFTLFIFLNYYFILGASREHPGTTEDQFGGSWGLQGTFCVVVTFQEIRNSWKSTFNVSRDRFRRNSGQSMRNRCLVIFQPSSYWCGSTKRRNWGGLPAPPETPGFTWGGSAPTHPPNMSASGLRRFRIFNGRSRIFNGNAH